MDDRSDTELVVLTRSGDRTAFGSLVERYQEMVRRIAFGMVGNEAVARELAQEALLQGYLSIGQLKFPARFRGWLCGITLNVCRSYLREQKIDFVSWETLLGGRRIKDFEWSAAQPDPQEVIEAQELHCLVLDAVDSLSPKNRSAILLFYYEELSVLEIADALGITASAVKARLHKSRQKLGQFLQDYQQFRDAKERRKAMIKVSIADVAHQKVELAGFEEPRQSYVIVLLDEVGQRALPIWVGLFEGLAIAAGLHDQPTPRPMTYGFMATILQVAGIEVVEVRIETLKDDTFYAVVKLRNGGKVEEVDARPSDAIALALRAHAPVHVDEDLMSASGIDVSGHLAKTPQLGKGLDTIFETFELERVKLTAAREQVSKAAQQTQRELVDIVFGQGK